MSHQQALTTGRPQICFVDWGPMPENDGIALRVGQTGFYLANDGIAAHEITVEDFEIEPGVWFTGATISRIREEGFALVWRKGSPAFNIEKWDLLGYMAVAAAKLPASQIAQVVYRVKVGAIYRDGFNDWYRSNADLIYIPTQGCLKFGPTTHETTDLRTSDGAQSPVGTDPEPAREIGHATPAPPRKRGRPHKIDVALKEAALSARERGESWKEVAKLLYASKFPREQQVKNAPNILNNYKRTRVHPPNNS